METHIVTYQYELGSLSRSSRKYRALARQRLRKSVPGKPKIGLLLTTSAGFASLNPFSSQASRSKRCKDKGRPSDRVKSCCGFFLRLPCFAGIFCCHCRVTTHIDDSWCGAKLKNLSKPRLNDKPQKLTIHFIVVCCLNISVKLFYNMRS